MKRIVCKITGNVQMVMFRDFTKKFADSLQIVGIVRNMTDGSVFVVAEGEEEKPYDFLKLLQQGLSYADVTKMDERWCTVTGEFSNFDIVF